ncbi:tRNA (guanosine(37)-N1)-methyltransferase TrmD [Caldicellulosiruptoraceae bacterium PP1]
MNFKILTLFPEIILNGTDFSILKRAKEKKIITIEAYNIRDYTKNKHKKVDDYPYGGGFGMVMSPQPLYDAFQNIKSEKTKRVIYLTPQGKLFNQELAKELSREEELVIICGHYEGIDERIIDLIVTDEISIGDYVLTGGEYAALILIDAISRLVDGVIEKESHRDESLENWLLEYPQYTRPEEFMGLNVPSVLLNGNHKEIEKWRRIQRLKRTIKKRPDIIKKSKLSDSDMKLLIKYCEQEKFMI